MVHNPLPFTSRADLHVHSRHSDRPSEWLLRRIGAPECFVEPLHVYHQALAAGMDFVTISDHNKIDGALEIAHLPNTFISNEVTTYFPENDAKMHVLVCGINEEQFRMIQELRANIYEFRQYLLDKDIPYSVAHPLFLVNEKLTLDQFEKLLVMFNRFEVINGTRDPRASQIVAAILDSLTPQIIATFADKYGIAPVGPNPHRKHRTGGSDDHSGLYIASAHTTTPQARTVDEFLNHLRTGRHEEAGRSGSSVHLAHCFYQIAYHYYKDRFASSSGGSILGQMLKRLLDPPPAKIAPQGRIRSWVTGYVWRRRAAQMSTAEQLIIQEFTRLFASPNRPQLRAGALASVSAPAITGPTATQAFEISCRLAHHLGFAFMKRMIEKIAEGDLIKTLEALAAMGPVALAITPYLAAFKTQHKDERFIQKVATHFNVPQFRVRSPRRAWLTDTYDDVNGVARTIQTLADAAHCQGRPLEVITSLERTPVTSVPIRNFQPIGVFSLPEYQEQKVAFPPFLEILEYIERQKFGELIISTPGPMGLIGLAAAKLLHLRTVGIYHTDFPNYVRTFTEDPAMEAITWRYMSAFFDQCDTILAPSDYYRRHLIEHDFAASKVDVLRRGVDVTRFRPEHRDEDFFKRFGGRRAFTYLYVGRVSSEKNLDVLMDAFDLVITQRPETQLAIVGDGPKLTDLRRRATGRAPVVFPGFLNGHELATAFASGDVFVFPSTTDTFGNVVAEAQAAGLPAIVSDRGGPQEIVGKQQSGIVLDLSDATAPARLAAAMQRLADDRQLHSDLRGRALKSAADMSWDHVLDHLWNCNEATAAAKLDGATAASDAHMMRLPREELLRADQPR